MKNIIFLIVVLISSSVSLTAQKVGLVLSGGGAKGITHIGIIKALEENNIPIDYVAGTSMGAIVAGMYSMGLTPDDMIAILKSKEFKYWSTGEIETEYIYYYRNADPKPSFIEVPMNINHLDSIDFKSSILPTNLISPRQMNYAFIPLCAQANAVADGNFDNLFVPFRCVASDIYNKKAVIFRKGDLGDAIRASMSFPFVFKPLVIDDRLLFDGGIFNNFPVDVMKSDFKPDYMIGSVVANNPKKPDERDIVMQIENMIMSKTDYSMAKDEGLLLQFETSNINTFDFSKIDYLVKMGYDSVIANIDEIKRKIKRRVTLEELDSKRTDFIKRYPKLQFQSVEIKGVQDLQKRYFQQVFQDKNKIFDLNDFKEAYFKLISDNKILEVLPHAQLDKQTNYFDLKLKIKSQDNLKLVLGGNISSTTSNQAYFGLNYQNLTEYAQSAYVDAQFGKMYNGLSLGTRLEVPSRKNWYMKLALVFHKFDYFEGNRLFYTDDRTADFTHYEAYSKFSVGFPLNMRSRLEFGLGYGALTDYYIQDRTSITTTTNEDQSIFSLGNLFGKVESFTMNDIMYPTKGYKHSHSLQMFVSEETFKSIDLPSTNRKENYDVWLQYKLDLQQYYKLNSDFTLGVSGEMIFSTRELLDNYTANIIEAPYFHPTPHSKTVFNSVYSANKYIALGIKPIYHINSQLHLRTEFYWFAPYMSFTRNSDLSASFSDPFSSSEFIAETSLVFNFRIASAALFLNHYSSAVSPWNFGLNIGFLLFNSKFTD